MNEYEETREMLREQARKSWPGKVGEERAERLDAFLDKTLMGYAAVLGVGVEEILRGMEKRRTYSAINYYQEANFPPLDRMLLFDDKEQMVAAICPEKGFRCPVCNGISTDAYDCTCDGCDWKSWGLLRTLGKGVQVSTRDGLLDGVVQEIFLPVSFGPLGVTLEETTEFTEK